MGVILLVTKSRKIIYLGVTLIIIIFILPLVTFNQNNNNPGLNPQGELHLSVQDQWLENNDFSSSQNWFYTKGDQGDNSSIDADLSGEQANFHVSDEERIFELFGTPNSTDSPDWYEFSKPDYYLPDDTSINSFGCYVSHVWNEQSNQFPGVHWRKNITMEIDMSKFDITSVDLKVMCNSSVRGSGDDNTGGIDVLGESYNDPIYGDQYANGDFVTYYVMISDIAFINPSIVALNKTTDLGDDNDGVESTIDDSLLFSYDDDVIISALNSAFEKDSSHTQFMITLGIDIYCEDNWGNDRDIFNYLYIKECNLTFTYERKIEKFTSVSWNQVGGKIGGDNVQIRSALFYFNYSISETWPYDLSPFSEIRILINDNPYRETITLSSMTTNLQHIRVEGTDFTSLFRAGVNISISIQIYIANTFGLNRTITVSIDDVYLFISYINITPEENLSPLVIGLTAGIIGIVVAFSLYQAHFKYPPLVRKIRKLKKRVKRGKVKKLILVNKREDIIKHNLNNRKNILLLESTQDDHFKKIEKISINKEEEL